MGRSKSAEAGTLPVTTAAAATVRFALATIVCAIIAAAAVFCFQGSNKDEHEGVQKRWPEQAREIPLVQVFEEGKTEGKIKPERTMLESSPAGSGVEAPKQRRPSLMNMQRTTVGMSTVADASLETRGPSLFKSLSG